MLNQPSLSGIEIVGAFISTHKTLSTLGSGFASKIRSSGRARPRPSRGLVTLRRNPRRSTARHALPQTNEPGKCRVPPARASFYAARPHRLREAAAGVAPRGP